MDEDRNNYYILVDAVNPVEPSLFSGRVSVDGRRLHLSENVPHDSRFSNAFRADFDLPRDVDLDRISSTWSSPSQVHAQRWLITLPKQQSKAESHEAHRSHINRDQGKIRRRRQRQRFDRYYNRRVPPATKFRKKRKAPRQKPMDEALHVEGGLRQAHTNEIWSMNDAPKTVRAKYDKMLNISFLGHV